MGGAAYSGEVIIQNHIPAIFAFIRQHKIHGLRNRPSRRAPR